MPTLGQSIAATLARSLSGGRSLEPRRLDDGTLGYYPDPPWRSDRCFASNLATLLQVPLEEVPDSHVDERLAAGENPAEVNRSAWALYLDWLAGRGLKLVRFDIYPTVPVPADRWITANLALPIPDRWIGVLHNSGLFQDHVVVMSGRRLLFDPYNMFKDADSPRLHQRLYYGLSVQPMRRSKK